MYFSRYLALWPAVVPFALAAQEPAPAPPPAAGYEVDFENQSLQVVLSALARAAGVNVTFSRVPDIRTTLRLGQRVSKDELLEIMKQVAEGNGLVMRQVGSLISISQPDASRERRWSRESPPDVRIYTYRLKYNNAVVLAPVLMNLFSGMSVGLRTDSGARQNREGGRGGSEGASNGGGNGVVVEATQQAAVVESLAQSMLEQARDGGARRAARRIEALDGLRQRLSSLAQSGTADSTGSRGAGGWGGNGGGGGSAARSQQSQVRIVAEEYTNTLLIRATPEEWEWIKKIIEEVD